MKKHIWWIGDKEGSIGSWKTKREAKKAIKSGLKSGFLNKTKTWKPIKHEVDVCPICEEDVRKDIIDSFGMCLQCEEHSDGSNC